jgi:beta-xylosidase
VAERKGFLRLKTARIDTSFLLTRNTLTQRTIGPQCSGSVSLDISNMKDGDFSGLGLLQKNYGLIGVKKNGESNSIVMINASSGKGEEAATIPLHQNIVFFKAECNFINKIDTAHFYYSLDGKKWTALGTQLKMAYTIPQFIGYRFALFNYATKNTGGYADFDYFHISENITGPK